MKNKSFFFENDMFIFTYHGGGCSPEHLKTLKRGTIKNFSRSSQKRLCLEISSIKDFNPQYKITLYYETIPPQDIMHKNIKAFIRSVTDSLCIKSRKKPAFFWKKSFTENTEKIEIITNAKFEYKDNDLEFVLKFFWNKFSKQENINIHTIAKQDLYNFCIKINDFIPEGLSVTGRWWGSINTKYYKKKEPKKIYASLPSIIKIEVSSTKTENNNFKKNIFKKDY